MQQNEIVDQKPFYMGDWLISPAKNHIQNDQITKTIQPKLIEVITYLCSKQGKIVSSDELIDQCWPNQYISDNPIHKCIAQLRKVLGDSSKNPKYITTVPKRGYSVIAKVSMTQDSLETVEPFWFNSSPFNGLKQYTKDQQNIFFGRSKEITDVLSLVDKKQMSQSSLIMLLSQSGCGKSSLAQAGIIPKLIHPYKPFKNEYVKSYTFTLAVNHEMSLAKAFLTFLCEHKITPDLINEVINQNHFEKTIDNLSESIQPDLITKTSQGQKNKQIIIFIDQLENVFNNLSNKQDSVSLFKIIEQLLLSHKCLVICALRNEYYQELIESSHYIKIRSNAYHYDVPALSYDEMSEIVRKPAQAAGLVYETNPETLVPLDTYIINKAQSIQASLPILQYTLSELYKNRKSKYLSYAVYKENGGLEGGLSTMAENSFLELSQSAQKRFEQLLHNLIQVNSESNNNAICKKAAIKSFTDEDSKNIIEIFINKRLFQTEWINNEPFLSITHDVLIKHWQRLQNWVKENTALLNTQHEVKTATNSWLLHNKSKDFLFHSLQPITAANAIKNNNYIHLNHDEKAFIAASNSKFSYAKRIKLTLMSSLVISLLLLSILIVSINNKNQQIIKTKNNAESLISFILFDLKDKLTPLGRIDLLDLVGSKTVEYFSNIEKENLSMTSLNHWIEALHIVGEASFTEGDYDKSYQSFLKADEILIKAISQQPKDIKVLEKHMLGNYWLGYLNFTKKDYQKSTIYLEKYLTLAQNLSTKQPDNQKWQLETSYAYNSLGTLSVSTNQLKKANDYFNNSIAIKKQLLEQQPQDQVLIADLADSISWIGMVKEKEGDLKQKLEINLKSLDLSRKLIELNPVKPLWIHRLSIALHRVALIYYDFGDLNQAKIHITESINNMQDLVINDKDNFTLKQELIFNYLLMAKINRHQKNRDKSLFYIQKSQSLLDLFKINLKYSKIIAAYNINLIVEQAIIMNELQQYESALHSIQKGQNIWQDNFANENDIASNELAQIDLALINLTKSSVLSAMNSENNSDFLATTINTLKPLVYSHPKNYKLIAIYLQLLKHTNNLGEDKTLIDRLLLASYSNPDFTLTDSDQTAKAQESKQSVDISLSH